MQFSALRTKARWWSKTDSDSFSDTDLNLCLNENQKIVTCWILDSMDEWEFNEEIGTASLVADQREYSFPTDILKIKEVYLKLDGTNWVRALPLEGAMQDYIDNTDIKDHYSNEQPYYDVYNTDGVGYFKIYCGAIIAVTGGIKLVYEKAGNDMSADADTPAFNVLFHEVLALISAQDYASRESLASLYNSLEVKKIEYKERIENFYSRRQLDRPLRLEPKTRNMR
ncbi:MAG: hypothetical protein ACOZBH_04565 [Patescibacteria group bacterium]